MSILLSTMMLDIRLTPTLLLSEVVGSGVTLMLCMFIIFPLRLSIKGWYQRLNGGFVPVALAFVIFTSPKRYLRAFYFGAIGFFVKLLSFLLCMLPCFFVGGLLRYALSLQDTAVIDSSLLLVAAADFILLIVGFSFGFFLSVRFFYMDYLFLLGKEKNPFKAIKASFKLCKENKGLLYSTLLAITPHLLSCIFILPIPFVIPKLAAIFAIHSKEVIGQGEEEHFKDSAYETI